VSFRLLRTLKEAGLIVAEDTRTTGKLLQKYGIFKKNIISYNEYNREARIGYIIGELEKGDDVALVSESGVPAIQDPGFKIINECIKRNIPVTVVPGPNAAVSALVISGLPTDSFLFVGFLPKAKAKRKSKLVELTFFPYTLIFYESPKRIETMVSELIDRFGDRRAGLVREISKIHEEAIRGKLSYVLEKIKGKAIKGEIVLVVEGYKKELIRNFTDDDIKMEFSRLLKDGISKKNCLKIIKSRYDIDKQRLYNISTKI